MRLETGQWVDPNVFVGVHGAIIDFARKHDLRVAIAEDPGVFVYVLRTQGGLRRGSIVYPGPSERLHLKLGAGRGTPTSFRLPPCKLTPEWYRDFEIKATQAFIRKIN